MADPYGTGEGRATSATIEPHPSLGARDSVLERAQKLVYRGDRQQAYGHPRENFRRIKALWDAYDSIAGEQGDEAVPIKMILMKIARLTETPGHEDSIIDIAGYAATLARVHGIDD